MSFMGTGGGKSDAEFTRLDAIEFLILAVKDMAQRMGKGNATLEGQIYFTAEVSFEKLGVEPNEVTAALESLHKRDQEITQEKVDDMARMLHDAIFGPPDHTQN